MLRHRFALALAGIATAVLAVAFGLAIAGITQRADIVLLGGAVLAQIALLVGWAVLPRLPRWLVAGYGLVLIATGFGFAIAGPVPDPGAVAQWPWALITMFVAGLIMIIAAVIHVVDRPAY